MAESLINERVDDIPVLLHVLEGMGLPRIINEVCPPHGNWGGLSIGETCYVWIAHILSTADHRLSHVQAWAARHINILSSILGKEVRELDFSDDRICLILKKLSNEKIWNSIESRLNQECFRVYAVETPTVRIDCTTVSSYALVDDDGLIQFGHSKDRPDLPQIKIPLATMDPLGLPLSISTVSGNCADDPLYTPTIQKVRNSLNKTGLIYIGDSKMSALSIRTELVHNGDYYLSPLPKTILPLSNLWDKINHIKESGLPLTEIRREYADGDVYLIAQGFEESVLLNSLFEDTSHNWEERRIYVQSFSYAKAQKKALDSRIQNASHEIEQMNQRGRGRKPPKTLEEAKDKGKVILDKYSLEEILRVTYEQEEEKVFKRKYGNNSSRDDIKISINCCANLNTVAYDEACDIMGWRVYATNKPKEDFSLEKVVLAYRNQYRIEDAFHRLKGHPTSLYPMYLKRDDHIDGLVKLASLAVRALVSIEMKIHNSLKNAGECLAGIYAYNPKKKTKKPRAEKILKIFDQITLTIVYIDGKKVVLITELSELQGKVLKLLCTDEQIYCRITGNL